MAHAQPSQHDTGPCHVGLDPTGLATDAKDILAWSQRRDEDAFARLVERHVGLVAAACRRHLGHGQAADDATQATMIILARRAGAIRDPARLGPWLYGVALHVCRTSIRAAGRRSRHERKAAIGPGLPQSSQTADDAQWDELRPHLDAALASLSTPQREAVVCHLLEGKSQDEVARQLGISKDAFRKRVEYALMKLRGWFAGRGLATGVAILVAGLESEAAAVEPVLVGDCVQAGINPSGSVADLAASAERSKLGILMLCAAAALLLLAGSWAILVSGRIPESPAAASSPVPPDEAPPWLDADFSRPLADFARAEASGRPVAESRDPVGLTRHLDEGWRTMHPRLRITLAEDGGPPSRAAIVLTGAARASPTSMIAWLAGAGRYHGLPGSALRRPDQSAMPPKLHDEWVRLSFGCDPDRLPRLSDLLSDLCPFSLRKLSDHPAAAILEFIVETRKKPELDRLALAWSGDLTVIVTPGPAGPGISVVAGLRTRPDSALITSLVSGILDMRPIQAPEGVRSAWQTSFLDQTWTVLMADRRIVVTTADDAHALLASAATAPGPAADVRLEVDFPRIVAGRARYPDLLPQLAQWIMYPDLPGLLSAWDEPGRTPTIAIWLGVDGKHGPALPLSLAPWSMAWTATPGGCTAAETGPLLLSTMLAACATDIAEADAVAETKDARERSEIAAIWRQHRSRLAAIRAIRPYLFKGTPPPEPVRESMRPWFAGELPTDLQLKSFGSSPVRRTPCSLVSAVYVAAASPEVAVWKTDGVLLWSSTLGDGWSVGIVGDPAGVPENIPLTLSAMGDGVTKGVLGNAVGLIRTSELTAVTPDSF